MPHTKITENYERWKIQKIENIIAIATNSVVVGSGVYNRVVG